MIVEFACLLSGYDNSIGAISMISSSNNNTNRSWPVGAPPRRHFNARNDYVNRGRYGRGQRRRRYSSRSFMVNNVRATEARINRQYETTGE